MLRPFFLTTIYRLTSAETDLALRLLAGQSLTAAAEPLGITYETARSRLKSIFRKTGTHRQGELALPHSPWCRELDGRKRIRTNRCG